jgi:glucosyl-3-phosphoglycerate synthase
VVHSEAMTLASFHADDFQLADLLDHKRATGTTISVVLPARNEEATVAGIVRSLRTHLMDEAPLVDELVVMDSFSTDATAVRAAEAGATVVACSDVLPHLPAWPGKGEALWRSLFVTTGDVVVFVDADLEDAGPHYVTGLLGPLLMTGRGFSKGSYRRPLITQDGVSPDGGGRVTELVARPLLNLYWPPLAQFVQPLAGEFAVRRELLRELRFPTGYGVEIAMLVDLLGRIGIAGMAQVDLGHRTHSHQSIHALGAMAAEVVGTALRRLDLEPPNRTLRQFRRVDGELMDRNTGVPLLERPPASSVAGHLPVRRPVADLLDEEAS